jgi:hypothetical protein
MARVLGHPGRRCLAKACAFLAILFAFAGCARQDSHVVTSGGQTYVLFHGLDRECIRAGIVGELRTFDWTLEKNEDSQIVARQPAPAWINTAVLLASFDPPLVQITLTILPAGADLKVLIDAGAIVDPAAPNPSVRPIPATAQMTAVFDNSVHRIEKECGGRP